jgi:hypothetical protein
MQRMRRRDPPLYYSGVWSRGIFDAMIVQLRARYSLCNQDAQTGVDKETSKTHRETYDNTTARDTEMSAFSPSHDQNAGLTPPYMTPTPRMQCQMVEHGRYLIGKVSSIEKWSYNIGYHGS